MSTIDFRKYLNAAGLGESAPVRRRKANIKPKAFNPMAFAESYKFIAEDGKRMALSNNRLNKELRGIAAKGEAGAEEFKEKFKEGMQKVQKVLIELYDKIIRFFTETVRYWMSNERKVAKTISNLNNAKKAADKKDTFYIPGGIIGTSRIDAGTGESFGGFGEKEEKQRLINPNKDKKPSSATADKKADAEVAKLKAEIEAGKQQGEKLVSSLKVVKMGSLSDLEIAEKAFEDATKEATTKIQNAKTSIITVLPLASTTLEGLAFGILTTMGIVSEGKVSVGQYTAESAKSAMNDIVEYMRGLVKEAISDIKVDNGSKETLGKQGYISVCDAMINLLTKMKGDGRGMRALNQQIRNLTEAKRKLQALFKEIKEPSEEETLKYQIARHAISTQTTLLNMYIGANDKLIGIGIQIAGKVIAAGN